MFECKAKFQQKGDYYRHWQNKHTNTKIPDGFIFVDEERKPYRKKFKQKLMKTSNYRGRAVNHKARIGKLDQ